MNANANEMSDRPDASDPGGAVDREASGLWWLALALAVIVADQVSKALAVSHLIPHRPVRVLPVLDFSLMYNTGAAFSFLAGASGWQRWLFIGLSLAVAAGIVIWLGRLKVRNRGVLACALALNLGGALGNVIDRVRIGHVVDFIWVHWHRYSFPWAFNVADCAITIGAALLMLEIVRESRGKPAVE